MSSDDACDVGLMADHWFVQIAVPCISQMARIYTKADQSNVQFISILLLFSIAPLEENTDSLVGFF